MTESGFNLLLLNFDFKKDIERSESETRPICGFADNYLRMYYRIKFEGQTFASSEFYFLQS